MAGSSVDRSLAIEEEKVPQTGSSSSSSSTVSKAISFQRHASEPADNGSPAPTHSGANTNELPSTSPEATTSQTSAGNNGTNAEKSAAPEDQRTKLQTTLIILSLCAGVFLAALDVTIVTVSVPTIAEEFHSTAGYTWIGSAYLLANAAAAPSWGKISDIWGRKPIILFAVGVFWIGSLLAAVSVNMGMLIAARAIQGVGGGGILILVNICVSDLFSMRKRGVYFGIISLVWAVSGGFGPVLGGVFTSYVTWRWCFYVNLPISGAAMVILFFNLKLHNPRTGVREGLVAVDWLGSLTMIGGTLMVLIGLEFGGVTYPWSSPTVICLIVFGFVVACLFVLVESKIAKYPVIPLRLFRNPSRIIALCVTACHGFVFISASYYLPLYFQGVLGADPLLSGVYVLPFTVSLGVTSSVVGFYIKKSGKYVPGIIGGFALMTLGYGLFIDLDPYANWPKIIIYQLILGMGTGPNFQSPLIALQTSVHPRDIASATATFGFIRQIATSMSVVIGGVIFQNGMQKQYPALLAQLGPDVAELLTGSNAAASVSKVAALTGEDGRVARGAYFNALRTMYIVYVCFAGLGFCLSFFVGSRQLSKEHTEHRTGLRTLRPARTPTEDEEGRASIAQAAAPAASGVVVGEKDTARIEPEPEKSHEAGDATR